MLSPGPASRRHGVMAMQQVCMSTDTGSFVDMYSLIFLTECACTKRIHSVKSQDVCDLLYFKVCWLPDCVHT